MKVSGLAATGAGLVLASAMATVQAEPPGICCLMPDESIERTPGTAYQVSGDNDVIVLTFEGLEDNESVEEFYDGGLGSEGSGPGPELGVTFSPNGLALIAEEAGGGGNFANNPEGDTILFFLDGDETVMNVPAGFEDGFSFFYSAAFEEGFIRVYDDLGGANGDGEIIAELDLPVTPPGDTQWDFDNWDDVGVSFEGTAYSVDFGGTANQVGFDAITIGSDEAGSPGPGPSPTDPVSVPVGGQFWALLMILGLLAGGLLLMRR